MQSSEGTKGTGNRNGSGRYTRSSTSTTSGVTSTTTVGSNVRSGSNGSNPDLSMANNFPSEVIDVKGTKFVMGVDPLPDSDNLSQLQKRHIIDYAAMKESTTGGRK